MKIKFYGARGSIPSPSRSTIKYGANTSCIEVRTRSNDIIILDAGTGIRRLGVQIIKDSDETTLMEKNVEFIVEEMVRDLVEERSEGLRALEGSKPYKKDIHLFLSHFHWDHIQGFPFFVPAYIPGYNINIYGQLKADHRLRDVFDGQQSKTYFPVYLDVMQAQKNFHEIVEDTIVIGDTLVTSRGLAHPQGCLGYRITCGEMTVAYATDNEHPEDGSINPNILELAENADIFIYDCQYTPDEYEMKKYWGHSTWREGIRIAREAGASKLILFHHDPEHDDEFIGDMERKARDEFPNLLAAYEGLEITDFPCEPTEMPEAGTGDEAAGDAGVESGDGAALVRIGENLRALESETFRTALAAALDNGARKVAFDCSQATSAARHGLIALADAVDLARRRGADVALSGAAERLHYLLKMARFDIISKIENK